jgi:mannose-1-phosphate guanylyltransferase
LTKSSPPDSSLWAVILAGGAGSRFWPVSTPSRPKQLLPLAGPDPLISATVDRILPLVPIERIRILAGEPLRKPIMSVVPALDATSFLVEPRARGTAAILAWAAHEIARHDPDGVMISLHSDHAIQPAEAFRELLSTAAAIARREQLLFTLGAVPDRPETGYGYIRTGAQIEDGAWRIAEFVEKPDRATAERYISDGYLWNTGLFVFPAALFLEQLRMHTPEIGALLPLLDAGDVNAFFDQVPNLTIDVGLLERTDRVGVMRTTFEWDDVGAWDAVLRTRTPDDAGNVLHGDAYAVETSGSVVWSDDGSVVVFGAQDLVVVRTRGVTLVAPRERVGELKKMIEQLPDRVVRGEDDEGAGPRIVR